MEQLEPRQMLAVNVLEPLGQLDTWEDGHDAIIDLRDVFESELDQPLVYEVQGDGHEHLVDATIEEWALRLQPAPQQSGTAEITVRAVGQLDGQQAVDTLTLNVAPVNDWPTLVEGFEALTLQEGATAVLDLTSHFDDLEQEAALLNYSAAPFEVSYPGNPIAAVEIEDGLLTLQATDDRFGYAKYAVRAEDEHGAEVATTLYVYVDPVNDAPVATQMPDRVHSLYASDRVSIGRHRSVAPESLRRGRWTITSGMLRMSGSWTTRSLPTTARCSRFNPMSMRMTFCSIAPQRQSISKGPLW